MLAYVRARVQSVRMPVRERTRERAKTKQLRTVECACVLRHALAHVRVRADVHAPKSARGSYMRFCAYLCVPRVRVSSRVFVCALVRVCTRARALVSVRAFERARLWSLSCVLVSVHT